MKQTMFSMRFQVQDPGFAEEFIARNGIEKLLTIIGESPERNVQVCITSLLRILKFFVETFHT
jgi:hypothetical protein